MDTFARIWTFLAIIASFQISQAYRILIVVPIPTSSHAILGGELVKTVLDAGHEVVYVTAIPKRLGAHPNLVEVDVSSNAKHFPTNIINITVFLEKKTGPPEAIYLMSSASFYSEETVRHEAMKLVLNDNKKFDLVIAEWMFSDMFTGFSALLDCPLIWFSSMEPHSFVLSLIDGNLHPAYNSDFASQGLMPFTFFERVQQLAEQIYLTVYREYYIYFEVTRNFTSFFGPLMEKRGRTLPPLEELRYNASLVFSNSHVSMGQPIRLPPNFIQIGGYHVDLEVKPLPEDLKNIMDSAKNGVIYFSMGSILRSQDFPKKLKMDLLDLFGRLKQTVLWKFEEDLENPPRNVHVLKWASQQSILAHPNCVLFITHGGLLSLMESVHYAVPVIGVPGFADQFVNVLRAEKKGYAKKVDLSTALAKDLELAIQEVIGNPRYKEKVKELSFVYHDRPVHPRKEIVHWVEHVIKTRGAPLLKSPALQLPFYQKLYLDLAVVTAVLIYMLIRLHKWLMAKCSRKCQNDKTERTLSDKKRK